MHINEAAKYVDESVENLRFMLMERYSDTFDELVEVSEDDIEFIERVKGITKDKPALLAAPLQEAIAQVAQQENIQLTPEMVNLLAGTLQVLAADSLKAGVISGTIRGQNFVAADKAAFNQIVVQHLESERDRTQHLLTGFVAENDPIADLLKLGIQTRQASEGKLHTVREDKSLDTLLAQVMRVNS